jgi:hypothetical protein
LDDAAAELTRAAALSPRAAAPLVALGRAALRRRTPRAAAAAFLSALERQPRCAPALTGLALIELSRGRARAAEAHLALALRYEPGYLPALYDISLLWLSAGRVEDALAARERLGARLAERAGATGAGGAAAGRGAARGGPLPVPARLRGADACAEYALTAALHRLGLVQGELPLPPPGFVPVPSATAAAAGSMPAAAPRAAPSPAKPGTAAAAAAVHEPTTVSEAEAPAPPASHLLRLVLISNEVGAAELLVAAALPGVVAVSYDALGCAGDGPGAAASAAIAAARAALAARVPFGAPLPRVASLALVTPPGAPPGALRLAPGADLALNPPRPDADTDELFDALRSLIGLHHAPPRPRRDASGARLPCVPRDDAPQMHLLSVGARAGAGAAGVDALRLRFAAAAAAAAAAVAAGGGAAAEHGAPPPAVVEVLAADDLFDPEAHRRADFSDGASSASSAAAVNGGALFQPSLGAQMALMYFGRAALRRWAARPEALRPPPRAPGGSGGGSGAPDAAAASTDGARPKRKSTTTGGGGNGGYAEYIKRRAAAVTSPPADGGGDASLAREEPAPVADAEPMAAAAPASQLPPWLQPGSARSSAAGGSDAYDSAREATEEEEEDDIFELPLPAPSPLRRVAGWRPPPPGAPAPWAAVQLLIDLPWRRFGTPAVQAYFLRELADEMDIQPQRLRVAEYHRGSGAVTVRILAPGDDADAHSDAAPLQHARAADIASAIELKCATGAMVLDGGFGDVLFLRRYTSEQAAEEAVEEAALAAGDVVQPPAAPLASVAPQAPVAAPLSPVPPPAPPPPRPRRLLLLCRRAAGWRDLVAAARPDVIVVPFSHECVAPFLACCLCCAHIISPLSLNHSLTHSFVRYAQARHAGRPAARRDHGACARRRCFRRRCFFGCRSCFHRHFVALEAGSHRTGARRAAKRAPRGCRRAAARRAGAPGGAAASRG